MLVTVLLTMIGTIVLPPAEPGTRNQVAAAISTYESTKKRVVERSGSEKYKDSALVAVHAGAFERLLTDLDGLPLADEELEKLFSIALMYSFEVETGEAVGQVATLYDRLVHRDLDTQHHARSFHRLLIATRRWADADEFETSVPDAELPTRPSVQTVARLEGQRYGYVPSADGAWLREVPLAKQGEAALVVSVHPRCNFSREALGAVFADEQLEPLMRDAVLLLSPYTDTTDGKVAAWNAAHPNQRMYYAIHQRDWPEISYWGTPSFYFLRDGEVVKKVVGWRADESAERKAALMEGFELIAEDPLTSHGSNR